MQGTISFHPVDLEFFDGSIAPLLSGGRMNPESYLDNALRFRRNASQARRYCHALETVLEHAEPQGPHPGDGLLQNVRARLDRLTHRPDELTRRIKELVEPDLHLYGRPFFITEGSAERVADLVDEFREAQSPEEADSLALEQLVRLDAELAKRIEPDAGGELSADLAYRSELLAALKGIYDLANAAREGLNWGRAGGRRRPAREALVREMPWHAVALHARCRPFWVAEDVDGLETIVRAAEVPAPDFLVPAWRLFAGACESAPELRESLVVELQQPRNLGAFVAPADVSQLLDFLNAHGSRIIQAATRHGEGATCRTLLRKIRECGVYAERHGLGYLEASGILPPDLQETPEPQA